jgi:hypothetical protein
MTNTITILGAVYGTTAAGFNATNTYTGNGSIPVNDTTFPDPALA